MGPRSISTFIFSTASTGRVVLWNTLVDSEENRLANACQTHGRVLNYFLMIVKRN
jgi:hypothetical protein